MITEKAKISTFFFLSFVGDVYKNEKSVINENKNVLLFTRHRRGRHLA